MRDVRRASAVMKIGLRARAAYQMRSIFNAGIMGAFVVLVMISVRSRAQSVPMRLPLRAMMVA